MQMYEKQTFSIRWCNSLIHFMDGCVLKWNVVIISCHLFACLAHSLSLFCLYYMGYGLTLPSWAFITPFPQMAGSVVVVPCTGVLFKITWELVWSCGDISLSTVLKDDIIQHDVHRFHKWRAEWKPQLKKEMCFILHLYWNSIFKMI